MPDECGYCRGQRGVEVVDGGEGVREAVLVVGGCGVWQVVCRGLLDAGDAGADVGGGRGIGMVQGLAFQPGCGDAGVAGISAVDGRAAEGGSGGGSAQDGGVVGGGVVAQEMRAQAGDEAAFGFVAQDGGFRRQVGVEAAVVFGAGDEEVVRGKGEADAAVTFVQAALLPVPVVAGARQGFGVGVAVVAVVVFEVQGGEAVGVRFVAQVVDAGAVYAGVVGAQCDAQGVVVMQEGQAGQIGVLGDEAVFERVHGVSGRGNGGRFMVLRPPLGCRRRCARRQHGAFATGRRRGRFWQGVLRGCRFRRFCLVRCR